jgi:hypothetical protein
MTHDTNYARTNLSFLQINAHRHTTRGLSDESTRLCDVVYYNIFDFNQTTDVVTISAAAKSD